VVIELLIKNKKVACFFVKTCFLLVAFRVTCCISNSPLMRSLIMPLVMDFRSLLLRRRIPFSLLVKVGLVANLSSTSHKSLCVKTGRKKK
jgi:hypothetical protein